MIAVTSYWLARDISADLDPVVIISLMDPNSTGYSIPHGSSFREHIKIEVHDVVEEPRSLSDLYVAPSVSHVDRLIGFAQTWDRRGNILVHCMAGVSRSTAAAFVILAVTSPSLEIPIARLIRERGPWADPNPLIVDIADKQLNRRGALVRALRSMGPSVMQGSPAAIMLPNEFGN